ncbi:hypothetical protein C817_01453 [Dorea sp. 5-2]|nr:hypothetical protein C817_01453 [Dorea sp. 5-2]
MSTPNYTILIIEDEKNISDFMSKALKSNGYRVITAVSGNSGLSLVSSQCPDIILLDLGLPDLDGNNVITSVRQWTSSPIIVISARTGEKDKVTALDLGADDYITKPFGTLELLARIRASLRHSNRMDSNSALYIRPYQCQGLLLDFDKRMLTLNGKEIHLTQIEYKIVAFLARNSGKVMTYSAIMSSVWGPFTGDNNRILRVNMANIRRKIEQNPSQPQFLSTEVGVGYRMREDENEL